MKFQVLFKTPDVLDQVLSPYIMDEDCKNCTDGSCGAIFHDEEFCCSKISEIQKCAAKFIQYHEEIVIEFDTEKQTAIVIPI